MGLRFILGRAGTGKTYKCLTEIAEHQKTGGNAVLIVPEQFSLQAEKELIAKTEGGAMLKARVLSFKRLAYSVFSKDGVDRNRALSGTAKIMVLRKILEEHKDELVFFKGFADKNGFMKQLSDTVTELYTCSVAAEELLRYEGTDRFLSGKLNDIYVIYKAYSDFAERTYLTDDGMLNLLLPKLAQSDIIKNSDVWIDGFYGFTAQEYAVIQRILKTANMVTVTLTMDEGIFKAKNVSVSSLFYEPWLTSKKLRQFCHENGINVSAVASKRALRYKNDTMKCFEESFLASAKAYSECEGLNIYGAENIYDEAEYTAKRIISLVRDRGLRYRDIAVTAASVNEYRTVIKGVFSRYNIPVFMDKKNKVAMHPLAEAVRSVIDIIAYDFTYESVFAYLKTGFSGIDREDIDLLENYCLAYGIKGWKWRTDRWSYGRSVYSEDDILRLNDIKEKVIKPFKEFFDDCGGNKKTDVKNICGHIIKFLRNINAAETLSAQTDSFKLSGNNERAYENEQCWECIMDILSEAAEILGFETMSVKEFAVIFDAGITESDMGIIPYSTDSVIIGDIKRSRLPDVKALFVMGVNDSILPSGADNNRLINDDERETLAGVGIELNNWGKRRTFEEEFLIYSALTKAEESVDITYSADGLDGAELKPSVIITKILRSFPGCTVKVKTDMDDMFDVTLPVPTARYAALNLKEDSGGFWHSVYDELENNFDGNITKFVKKLNKTINRPVYLDKKVLEKLYSGSLYTSISRLEKYASCPFSYFMTYNLKAEPRKLYSIDNPDIGSLLHEIIDKFSEKLRETGTDWRDITREECDAIIEKITDETAPSLKDELLSSSGAMRYITIRLKRIAKRSVWTLICHIKAGLFTPYGYEIGFGAGEQLPPVIIELDGGGKLVLNGKIDRVDYYDKDGLRYVKVIDYKTGAKAFSLKDIYYGLQLQLVFYMDCVLKSLERDGIKASPGGMFYYRVSDPVIKTDADLTEENIEKLLMGEFKMTGLILKDENVYKALDLNNYGNSSIVPVSMDKKGETKAGSSVAAEDDYSHIIAYAENMAAKIGKNIIEGKIPVSPYADSGKSPCNYCLYKSVCLIDDGGSKRKLTVKDKKEYWDKFRDAN